LARSRGTKGKTNPTAEPTIQSDRKGKGKAIDEDIEAAMDAELKAVLDTEDGEDYRRQITGS
jgi:hypothetical protein